MKVYRLHLTSGDQDYPTKEEAFAQAHNIARASQHNVWITEEEVEEPPC